MTFFTLGKVLLALLWVAALVTALFPSMAMGGGLLIKAAAITLIIHVIELVFIDGRLRQLPNPLWQRVQVLLFGYFHWGRLGKGAEKPA
ncbi:DUF1145 domain-containing protein [Halopseudomonas pelagia]|uniref:DUF1145 domain-containing protein n=1 Tax=Halopseudomonas pelagia TaxID=553151 RepID=UPI00039F2C7E|nr:DUF1145 domain-containing protein [Halopseudomonas pelagia]